MTEGRSVSVRRVRDRVSGTRLARSFLRTVFPDHWSFLLGEIALYCFVILLVTGTLLAVWFQPSMTEVVYHGSYLPLRGVRMSQAYTSALKISFDVRGGLLLRQIHHWASDVFLAVVMAHMIRVFFRSPPSSPAWPRPRCPPAGPGPARTCRRAAPAAPLAKHGNG